MPIAAVTTVSSPTEPLALVAGEAEQDAGPFLGPRSRAATTVGLAAGRFLGFDDADSERHLALARPITHLGRGLVSDVRIEHPRVSRSHTLIIERAGRCAILDDRSLNGTFVNGRRVERAELRDGDVVRLGCVTMRYREFPVGADRDSNPGARIMR